MTFIETVDGQLINTQYITRIYYQLHPANLKWFIGCSVAHEMGERILCTGLECAGDAYLQMKSIIRSMGGNVEGVSK